MCPKQPCTAYRMYLGDAVVDERRRRLETKSTRQLKTLNGLSLHRASLDEHRCRRFACASNPKSMWATARDLCHRVLAHPMPVGRPLFSGQLPSKLANTLCAPYQYQGTANGAKRSKATHESQALAEQIGGDGGIRTLDPGFSPDAPLAGEYLRPLGHVSCPCPNLYRADCAVDDSGLRLNKSTWNPSPMYESTLRTLDERIIR